MSKSINRPLIWHSYFLHSFHPFTFTFERETEFCTVRVRQPTKEVLSFCWEIISSWETNCHLSSKHHCEGNICLKEIVSNTRLDLQTGSDYFSGFPANVLIVRLLLGLFFFTVLIPNKDKY